LAPTTEVGCGLQKYSTFSKKRAKILTIFFFIFLIFFGNFDETEQGRAKVVKQSVVERG
jgi:preprotein translocase subunit SecG